jgi:hypothetical protein
MQRAKVPGAKEIDCAAQNDSVFYFVGICITDLATHF